MIERATVVIPCYNEALRIDPEQVSSLIADPRITIMFVNDGSSDRTLEVLTSLQTSFGAERISILDLATNSGKAEAVRQGILAAMVAEPECVGYLDADFAASAAEYLRLLDIMAANAQTNVVLGARVALLGRRIERSPMRHYSGRLFGSLASAVLGLRVYDTQCGAKIFRAEPRLLEAMQKPFISRWVFDVEILSRITQSGFRSRAFTVDQFIEVPLREWRDVAGSNLHSKDALVALWDLGMIWRSRRTLSDKRAASVGAER